MSELVEVTIPWPAYNRKQWNGPWVARITSWTGGQPVREYISNTHFYDGTSDTPAALIFLAEPASIICFGQVNKRRPNVDSIRKYAQILSNGGYQEITPTEARAIWRGNNGKRYEKG